MSLQSVPPAACSMCERPDGDCTCRARQYVPPDGQKWTTLEELRAKHSNVFTDVEPGVVSIHTEPAFAIGQRAFLIDTGEGEAAVGLHYSA